MTAELRIHPLPGTGAHLVSGADGRHRVRLRTGRLTLLDAPPDGLVAAIESAPDGEAADYLHRLTGEVQTREAEDASRRWPTARRAVCLLGSDPILDDLGGALAAWGAAVTRLGAEEEPPQDAALVIAYADDARGRRRWLRHDQLPRRGVAWLRAHRDGECVLIEPLALDGDDPTSVQVATRRAAASSAPTATEAWHRAAPPASAPVDDATRVLVLGRLLQIAAAWAQDGPSLDRLRTTLWKLVPALGAVTEHTVLAYPAAPERVIR
ncbi:hypothetical protein [Microbacterium sp. LWH10-1.2]|uniref:hypothetical protein n=1 Tax=unclassified Microbacterium TaxID=2609290 RepID=UPI00313977D8